MGSKGAVEVIFKGRSKESMEQVCAGVCVRARVVFVRGMMCACLHIQRGQGFCWCAFTLCMCRKCVGNRGYQRPPHAMFKST